MSKQILIVVDSIDVNDSSGSKANVALIKNIVAIGYNVKVLHYTRKAIMLDDISCISIPEKKYNMFYLLSRMQRVIQRYFKVNLAKFLEGIFGFSFTFFNDVNSIKTALRKCHASEFDLVMTLSKGASFRPHYAVNKLSHLHNKWMAYIHDPYPFSCYPSPYQWVEPGHKQKRLFLKEVSKNAKYAAFPSLLLKQWMGNFFANFIKTGVIIPHQNFEEKSIDIEEPSYYDKTKFNVLHAGNLMKQRDPEGLLKGFKLFLKNNPEAKNDSKLILLGSASYHEDYIKAFATNLPQLYTKLSNTSFEHIYWLQKQVSVNIILEADSEISPFLPGKFPHCVAANKPILHLGPKHSETKRLLGEDYPYWSEIHDAVAISKVLNILYTAWKTKNNTHVLDRPDLEAYLGETYLKEQFQKVFADA
jgi:glycosyltransferase involved in cell wall biosynthesis